MPTASGMDGFYQADRDRFNDHVPTPIKPGMVRLRLMSYYLPNGGRSVYNAERRLLMEDVPADADILKAMEPFAVQRDGQVVMQLARPYPGLEELIGATFFVSRG